jgi:MinD superfamily P-loop ATPase
MRIAVTSGKGGTGKTTLATGLALALGGERSGPLLFLDCDVEAPNAHLFLDPRIEERIETGLPVPEVDEDLCSWCGLCAEVCEYNALAVSQGVVLTFRELCHGCGSCTLVCPEGAITESHRTMGYLESGTVPGGIRFARGILNVGEAMAVPVIRSLKQWALHEGGPEESGEPGTVILDTPPGTTCPVVESLRDVDYALLVTEPTPFGLHDLRLIAEVVADMEIPAGVVINRDGTGYHEVEQFCDGAGLPVLLRIPFDRRIAEGTARRRPLTAIVPEYAGDLRFLHRKIREAVGSPVR